MKIHVKKDLCCGVQICIRTAPKVYRLDELGYNASDGEDVPLGQEAAAQRAAHACPEGAIILEGE